MSLTSPQRRIMRKLLKSGTYTVDPREISAARALIELGLAYRAPHNHDALCMVLHLTHTSVGSKGVK